MLSLISDSYPLITSLSPSFASKTAVMFKLSVLFLTIASLVLIVMLLKTRYGSVHPGLYVVVIMLTVSGYVASIFVKICMEMYMKHMDAWYYRFAVSLGFDGDRYYIFVSLVTSIVSAVFSIIMWIIVTRAFYVRRDMEKMFPSMWVFVMSHIWIILANLFISNITLIKPGFPDLLCIILQLVIDLVMPGFALRFLMDLNRKKSETVW
ncbi:MAG: hypothetical protein IKE53_00150 [Clostridiales bacterium]|nr:hypothetical protein [Clostridiales bacterium]